MLGAACSPFRTFFQETLSASLHFFDTLKHLKQMAYFISAPLDKLTCRDFSEKAERPDSFWGFPFYETKYNFLSVSLELFKKYEKRGVRFIPNPHKGDFNQFKRLRNHLVFTA